MNMFRKGMIFVTFFTSCLAIALLVASLGTKQWVNARARRTSNPQESDGRVHFGLFEGKKELNVAYGWRSYDMHVIEILKHEEDFMVYSIWLATITTVCLGLLFAILAAIFAVINTATNPAGSLSGVPGLYAWNSLALISDAAAVGLWVAQYFLKLQYSVMMKEDKENMWTSENMAELGVSFWFVVGGAVVSFINIIIIYIGNSETRESEPVLPMIEEKSNGAIMLY
ncbi:uncharacterized protein CBL_10209 [Carabus blaptoides fortunei]